MSAALELTLAYSVITCCHAGCGLPFAVPMQWMSKRRDDHQPFYCPNGHEQGFYGKSEAERLREEKAALEVQVKAARAAAEWKRRQTDLADRRAAAARGQVTKMKRRAAGGACPCCNRTFEKLARHMKSKHPEYASEETP